METCFFLMLFCFTFVCCVSLFLLLLSKYRTHRELVQLLKRVDAEYLALYGVESYRYMLRRRKNAAGSSAPVDSNQEGIWYSRCTPQRLLQIIEIEHIKSLMGENPCPLCTFVSDLPAEQIELCGSWSDELGTYYQELQLAFTVRNDGRTAVKFRYVGPNSHPYAKQVIKETSAWLKGICEHAA